MLLVTVVTRIHPMQPIAAIQITQLPILVRKAPDKTHLPEAGVVVKDHIKHLKTNSAPIRAAKGAANSRKHSTTMVSNHNITVDNSRSPEEDTLHLHHGHTVVAVIADIAVAVAIVAEVVTAVAEVVAVIAEAEVATAADAKIHSSL